MREKGILKSPKTAGKSGDSGEPKSSWNVWNQRKELRGIMEEKNGLKNTSPTVSPANKDAKKEYSNVHLEKL